MPLPTFLVIGAQKCGTSSLHEYLSLHPEVEMPPGQKELDFFLDRDHGTAARGREWYESQWTGATSQRGEASPNYTAHPFHSGVPSRAAALVPDAKLIFLARDPIDRVVSHYVHRRAQNLERRSLPETLRDLDDPINGLVQRSLYMQQLDRWLEHFDADRLLMVVSERLRARREDTLDRIFAFLEVSTGIRDDSYRAEHNAAGDRLELTSGGLALERMGAARRLRGLVPARVRAPLATQVRRRLSTKVDVPDVPVELRRRLEAKLGPDIERLRAFTGDALQEWSV